MKKEDKILKRMNRRKIDIADIAIIVLIATAIFYGSFAYHEIKEHNEKWEAYATEQLAIIEDIQYKEPTNPAYELSPAEFEMVAGVVAAEARGQCLTGQMAVAQTIRDRAVERGQSIEDALTAPNQYAAPYKGPIDDTTYLAVDNIFNGGWYIFEYPTTHFFNPDKANPDWAKEFDMRGIIGDHAFYE